MPWHVKGGGFEVPLWAVWRDHFRLGRWESGNGAARSHDETLPAESRAGWRLSAPCAGCGPKFCSMKISQEVRERGAAKGNKRNSVAAGDIRAPWLKEIR